MFARAVDKFDNEKPVEANINNKTNLKKPASILGKPKGSTSNQQNIQSTFFNKSSSNFQQRPTGLAPYGSSQRSQLKPSLRDNSHIQADSFTPNIQPLPSSAISNQTSQQSTSTRSSSLLSTLDTYSHSFQENEPPPPLGQIHVSNMASLHEAVYFDENDFDDDLNFDDEPLLTPTLKAAIATLAPAATENQLPKNPPPATPTHNHNDGPHSSAPLPWSSSPLPLHKPTAAPTRTNGRIFSAEINQRVNATAVAMASSTSIIERSYTSESSCSTRTTKAGQEQEPPSRLNKVGRKLPWAKVDDAAAQANQTAPKSEYGAAITSKRALPPPATPNQKSRLPWEATASVMKEARKDLKATKTASNKRSITTTSTDSDAGQPHKKKKEQIAPVFLSEEQQRVIHLVKDDKRSVFFTGSAGTGKSVLLRELIAQLRRTYAKEPDRVAVTASTGLAACNIGGMTLHSFGGIGLGKDSATELVKRIKQNAKAKQRWIRTKILIIDEISMVDGDLFDKLEHIARSIRNVGKPFGGIQLIITGDFFQLPPVPDGRGAVQSKFAFEAATWNICINHTIGLTQVFRQKDPVFANMLNQMRLGILEPETVEAFRKLQRPIVYEDGIEPTELFPTRSEVDAANNIKMRQITGKVYTYPAVDSGSSDLAMREKLLANVMAPAKIDLKKNAQVMLIKNIDESLVNGSLGRVVGFMTEETWALMGGDYDIASLSEFKDPDEILQAVENEEDDPLTKRTKRIQKQIAGKDNQRKWPLVQFSLANGTFRQMLIHPEQWKVELPNGQIQASRLQLPLILAWALSIHKAQGQTLERVKVDLGKVFERGQAYVALSRATCQEGLQILRFDPAKVKAHDKVRIFYNNLYSAAEASAQVKAVSAPKYKVVDEDEDDEVAYGAGG